MRLTNAHELFVVHLKDLFSAESQLTKALPKMAEAATNETLRMGFEEHLRETEGHVERLEQIAKNLEIALGGHACKAMQGLIAEGEEFLKSDVEGEPNVIDAALIAAAQKVEHYEISGYGTAVALAKLMGHSDEVDLLSQTLEEEKATDEKLTKVAEEEVNGAMDTGM